ncbi:hypothetical protein LO763_22055 [Glycomyces sp. A-F 0318]|uniref:hypothetical protein n=1 Tax=Glycomyces amatae TaxID=2881355 RepID=UPI001E2C2D00|nr:hypothetical protein [Glycomyces amatae]MCD0446301.1 hypothetical protein [Glycomyces amatae]
MPAPRVLLAVVLAAALNATSGCMLNDMDTGPPTMSEQYTDLAALYPVMEGLVTEAIAPLEHFPGFHSRMITTSTCTGGKHDLEAFPGTATAKLDYEFAEAYWDDPAVRVDLLEAVKARWVALGYDIDDDVSGTGKYRTVTATADGEVFIRFRSLGVVLMDVYHTACVESGTFNVPAPVGGVLPKQDRADIETGTAIR